MNRLIESGGRRLKETLEVFDLVELQTVGFSDGREKHGFGVLSEEFEQFMGDFHGALSFSLGLLKKGGDTFIHSVHELVNSLGFEVRGNLEQFLPMGRMFDLLLSSKASRMKRHPSTFDPDLHLIGIGQQFTGGTGEGRGNRVTIRVKLDKSGLSGLGEDPLVG
jgi:hypothetical protein